MLKKIRLMSLLILTLALIVIVQLSTAQAQTSVTVEDSRPIADAKTQDDILRKLDKTLDALEAAESVIDAKTKENAALKSLNSTNEQISAQQKAIIENQEKLIQIYIKKSRPKLSILFGLISVRF